MKLSLEDKFKRGFLFFAGALLAVPTYIMWSKVVVGHQWPDDFNGWLGLLMMPTFSILSFVYAIFYRRVKAIDDRLEKDMDDNTRRGKAIYAICISFMFLLLGIYMLELHVLKHKPMQTWEYVAVPLLVVMWVCSLLMVYKVDDEQLHDFLVKNNLRWLDRMIFKDYFDDEE